VVASGAYYNKATYPADFATKTEDDIASALVDAARAGRFGAFGEIGVANEEADMDPLEKKVFRAFGMAQTRTGLPIFTHNNYSTGHERADGHGPCDSSTPRRPAAPRRRAWRSATSAASTIRWRRSPSGWRAAARSSPSIA
jgi:hypothetical protein